MIQRLIDRWQNWRQHREYRQLPDVLQKAQVRLNTNEKLRGAR